MAKLTIEIDNIPQDVIDMAWRNAIAYGRKVGDLVVPTRTIRIDAANPANHHPVTLNKLLEILSYAISFHCVHSRNIKDN